MYDTDEVENESNELTVADALIVVAILVSILGFMLWLVL